jgi:hypothetical protein
MSMGRGGITQKSRITGVSRVTITLGMKEFEKNNAKIPDKQRCRKEGGGRKSVKENYPKIKSEIEKLLAPYTKGDPMNPLKYIRFRFYGRGCLLLMHEWLKNGMDIPAPEMAKLMAKLVRDVPA